MAINPFQEALQQGSTQEKKTLSNPFQRAYDVATVDLKKEQATTKGIQRTEQLNELARAKYAADTDQLAAQKDLEKQIQQKEETTQTSPPVPPPKQVDYTDMIMDAQRRAALGSEAEKKYTVDNGANQAFFDLRNGVGTFFLQVGKTVPTMTKAIVENVGEVGNFAYKYTGGLLTGDKYDINTENHPIKTFSDGIINEINQAQIDLTENTDNKWIAIAGQAAGSVISALGIAALTKSPAAAAAFLTPVESSDFYNNARDAGKSPMEALGIASVAGVGTYVLEKYGIENLLNIPGSKNIIGSYAQKILFEGAQEGTQQLYQNTIEKLTIDNKVNVLDGVLEAVVGGMFGGGIGAVFANTIHGIQDQKQINKALDMLTEAGISNTAAKKLVKDMQNAVQKGASEFIQPFREQTYTPDMPARVQEGIADTKAQEAEGQLYYGNTRSEAENLKQEAEQKTLEEQIANREKQLANSKVQLSTPEVEIQTTQNNDGTYSYKIDFTLGEQSIPSQFTGSFPSEEVALAIAKNNALVAAAEFASPTSTQNEQESARNAYAAINEIPANEAFLQQSIRNVGEALGLFEQQLQSQQVEVEQFKLYRDIRDLAKKYEARLGQGYTPRGTQGVFYTGSKNIRAQGLNNLSVVSHELFHYLDDATGLTTNIQKNAKEYPALVKELGKVYEQYYPSPRKNASENVKIAEGLATFFQQTLKSPTHTAKEYPLATEALFDTGSPLYNEAYQAMLTDARGIVQKYQAANALQKMQSLIVDKLDTPEQKETFFNVVDNITTSVADIIYPIEVLEARQGLLWSENPDAPSLALRRMQQSSQIMQHNIMNKGKGYLRYRDGEIVETLPYNFADMMTALHAESKRRYGNDGGDQLYSEFGAWLVARRTKGMYERKANYETLIEENVSGLHSAFSEKDVKTIAKLAKKNAGLQKVQNSLTEEGQELFDSSKELYIELAALEEKVADLDSLLIKNGILEDEALEAYEMGKSTFQENGWASGSNEFASFEEMFTKLTQEDLHFLGDKDVQILDPARRDLLLQNDSYASFKRYIEDGIVAEFMEQPTNFSGKSVQAGGMKIGALSKFTGSDKPILNPLYSAIMNHVEIGQKANKQLALNKLNVLFDGFPEFFQVTPYDVTHDKSNKHLIVYKDYKKVSVLMDPYITPYIQNILTPETVDAATYMGRFFARLFSIGTTGVNTAFVFTNFFLDQLTSAAQTMNQTKPLYDPLKALYTYAVDVNLRGDTSTPDAQYAAEYLYLGGERQAFTRFMEMSPQEVLRAITKEHEGLNKIVEYVKKGGKSFYDLITIPGTASEIATRMAEYINARKNGRSQFQAFEMSARVTAPFIHKGSRKLKGATGLGYGSFYKIYPYFSAQIQATAQAIRSLGQKQTRQQVIMLMAGIAATYMGAFGATLASATPCQKEHFKGMPIDMKMRYVFIPDPTKECEFVRLRVPDFFAYPGALLNLITSDVMMGTKYKADDYLNAGTSIIPDQVNITDYKSMVLSLLPPILKPSLEVIMNTKTFPDAIPLESRALQELPPEYRTGKNTSDLAKGLAMTLKDVTDLSPIQIDHLLKGTLGRSVEYFTGQENPLDISSGFQQKYYFTASRQVRAFFDAREDVKKEMKAIDAGVKQVSREEKKILKQKEKNLENIYNEYKRWKKAVDKYGEDSERANKYRDSMLEKITTYDIL